MTHARFITSLAFLTAAVMSQAQSTTAAQTSTSHPAKAEAKKKDRWMGVDIGAYLPTNSVIRDAYGTGLKLGFSPVTRIRNDKWHLDLDTSLIEDNHAGNKLLIVPVNAAYERSFGPEEAESQPFIRFSAGAVYNDHSFNTATSHQANKTVGADAAVEIGTVLSQKWRLSGRYNLFTKSDGFDFNGFTVSLQYSAFRY